MEFTISRNNFYHTLQKIINVIPAKSTVDILYNVLLIAEENQLRIIATDLEITQIAWSECEVIQEGSVTVPGKLLLDIIREMPDINMNFKVDNILKIIISSEFGEYKLSGQSKNEYPSVPLVDSEEKLTQQNGTLKRMIEKTIFACSSDSLRPALTGVLCQILEEEYRMIATDGHRLVKIINNKFSNPGFIRELIIPTKALNFVARNLPEEGEHQIVISDNHVLFDLPNTKIYTRIIKDPFPDYERVIPVGYSKVLKIEKDKFVSAVKRVSLFSNPMTNQIILKLDKNRLEVNAQDIDFGGEAKESVECTFDHGPMEMAYNAIYLLDLLRHVDSDTIRFEIEEADGPGLIFPDEQKENEELLMLIMPVRANE